MKDRAPYITSALDQPRRLKFPLLGEVSVIRRNFPSCSEEGWDTRRHSRCAKTVSGHGLFECCHCLCLP